MDGSRFDALTRSLSVRLSRRVGMGLLAAVGLRQVVPLAEVQAKNKHCPPCRKKKHGRCKKRLPDGTPCGGECRECRNGACAPKANRTPCGGECTECQDGVCAPKVDGTRCAGACRECRGGQCVSACTAPATVCGARTPGVCCTPDGGPCDPAHPEVCCSTACGTVPGQQPRCTD
jgi:hypothetical protein